MDYLVAYTILNGSTGVAEGTGTITWQMSPTPRTNDEVLALGQEITQVSHQRGRLHGQYAHVLSWSRMGA